MSTEYTLEANILNVYCIHAVHCGIQLSIAPKFGGTTPPPLRFNGCLHNTFSSDLDYVVTQLLCKCTTAVVGRILIKKYTSINQGSRMLSQIRKLPACDQHLHTN